MPHPDHPLPGIVPVDAGGVLNALLADRARIDPEAAALRPQPGSERWSGRVAVTRSWSGLADEVACLAALLQGLALPAGASLGILLPGGPECAVALLAAEAAGLTACLLPLGVDDEALTDAAEQMSVQALLTQSRVGTVRPGERACALAFRAYAIRHVLAFGPDVPDGALDLDAALALAGPARPTPVGAGRMATFAMRDGRPTAVTRSTRSLVAAAGLVLPLIAARAGERILAATALDGLAAIATSLVPGLLTGCALECHGLFDPQGWRDALADPVPTHLQAPAAALPALRPADGAAFRSVTCLGPLAATDRESDVIEVASLNEVALLAGRAGFRELLAPGSLDRDRDLLDGIVVGEALTTIRPPPTPRHAA